MAHVAEEIKEQIKTLQEILSNSDSLTKEDLAESISSRLSVLETAVNELMSAPLYTEEDYTLIAAEKAHFSLFLESVGFNHEEISNIASSPSPDIKLNKYLIDLQLQAQRFAKQNNWEYIGILNDKAICKTQHHGFSIHDVCISGLENGKYAESLEEIESIALEKIKIKCKEMVLEDFFLKYPHEYLSHGNFNEEIFDSQDFTPKRELQEIPKTELIKGFQIKFETYHNFAKGLIHNELEAWRQNKEDYVTPEINTLSSFLSAPENQTSNHIIIK